MVQSLIKIYKEEGGRGLLTFILLVSIPGFAVESEFGYYWTASRSKLHQSEDRVTPLKVKRSYLLRVSTSEFRSIGNIAHEPSRVALGHNVSVLSSYLFGIFFTTKRRASLELNTKDVVAIDATDN
ncbi:hypothetical protein PsorP6_017470 [Peronosclerospora sorghi]|uniref:Uncharacterized protein n=1 Tax=Peronosclerospora sorghi TaxID=230839 RepID=A0ACC0WLV1_9STRA|nr:hypothetical protein PsorP6_017470 [Peronosclerospora sorghi]